MKKSRTYLGLIGSVALLLAAASALVAASFAWFHAASRAETFEVAVEGRKDIEFWFYRKDPATGAYEPVTAEGAATLSGTLVPGEELSFRIRVVNKGAAGRLTVTFTDLAAARASDGAPDAFFSPYLMVDTGGAERPLFAAGEAYASAFTLVKNLPLPYGAEPVDVDYTYRLLPETPAPPTGIEIAAKGMVFTVD